MNLTSHSRAGFLALATLGALWAAGCSDDDEPTEGGAGGMEVAGGGAKPTGGAVNKGGGGVGATGQGGAVTGGAATTTVAGAGATPAATGGAATGGAATVGGGGAATGGAGPVAGSSGAGTGCGTAVGSFTALTTTFAAGTALPLNGFAKNANGTAEIVTTPSICSGGCLKLSGTWAAGSGAFSNAVGLAKPTTSTAFTNLVGAKIVVRLAVDNPAGFPLSLSVWAQGSNGSTYGLGAISGPTLANYTVAGGIKEYSYTVADALFDGKQFCASSVGQVGIFLQPNASVTTAGTPTAYLESISIQPSGYVPTGTGGASGTGGGGGAAGALTAGYAGTAGNG